MFDQNADETLNGAQQYSVNHDRAVFLAIRACIFCLKPQRKLEIKLYGTALPGAA